MLVNSYFQCMIHIYIYLYSVYNVIIVPVYDIRHRYLMSRNYIYREFLILWKKRDFWMIDLFFFPPQFTGVFFKVFLTDFFLGILFHSCSRSPSKCFDWFLSWHSFTVEVHEMWSWRFCFRIKIVYFPFLDNYQM